MTKGLKRYAKLAGLLLMLAAGTVTAGSGLTWTVVNPPGSPYFTVLLSGGGSYVAAGQGGILYLSTDGTHWTAETNPLGSTARTVGGIYAAGEFVLEAQVATDTHLLSSSDGITWVDELSWSAGTARGPFLGYDNGTFIALNGPQVATSSDGVSWTLNATNLSTSDAGNLNSLYPGNGVFLLATNDKLYGPSLGLSSTDGIHWTKLSTPPEPTKGTLRGEELYTDGSTFFAVLNSQTSTKPSVGPPTYVNYTYVFSSTDAVHWTKRALSGNVPGTFFGVVRLGAKFVDTGVQVLTDHDRFHTFTSPDGLAWTDIGEDDTDPDEDTIAETPGPGTAVWTGSGYLAINTFSPSGLYQSTDLLNWTPNFSATNSPVNSITQVAFLNGQYIAMTGGIAGDPSSPAFTILQSNDGITWNSVYQTSGLTGGPYYVPTIAFGNGVYVATDGNNWVSSADGLSWTPIAHPPARGTLVSTLAFANGQFAGFVDTVGTVASATSTDGVTWKSNALPKMLSEDEDLAAQSQGSAALASTGAQFIALDQGTAYSSSDGASWVQGKSFGIANGSVVYANITATANGYIAGGTAYSNCVEDAWTVCLDGPYAAIAASPDGSTWTPAAVDLDNAPASIISIGSGYVGVDQYGELLYGKDADHWCREGFPMLYYSIAPTAGGFLLAGGGGIVESTTATETDLAAGCMGGYSSVISIPAQSSGTGGGTTGGTTPSKSSGGGGDLSFIALGALLGFALQRRGGARRSA